MKKLIVLITLVTLLLIGCQTKDYVTLTIKDRADKDIYTELYLQDPDGEGYVIDEPAVTEWGLKDRKIGDEVKAELNEYGEILGVR